MASFLQDVRHSLRMIAKAPGVHDVIQSLSGSAHARKLLPADTAADQQARGRLRHEAMAAAALAPLIICRIFEIGEYGESVFLVIEYIAGETLDRRLRHGRMPRPEALHLAGEIAEALQEVHEQGILHRDLKPSNIMLTQQGHVRIMDFGLAKRLAYPPQGLNCGAHNSIASLATSLPFKTKFPMKYPRNCG